MEYRQIAGGPEAQTKDFDRIAHEKRFAAIDGILTAFEFFLGCWHRKLSRPFTLSGWTYEVCLVCGRKFAYNRAEIGGGVPQRENIGHSKFTHAAIHAELTTQHP